MRQAIGRACRKCGQDSWHPNGGPGLYRCAPCGRAREVAYRAAHPEKWKAKNRAWYDGNREQINAANRAWAKANPDKVKDQARAWRKANPQRARENARAWTGANPEKAKAYQKKYRTANPGHSRAQSSRYHALIVSAPGLGVSTKQRQQVLTGSLGFCTYCNRRSPLTLDHIDALQNGGEHDVTNVTACCRSCNASKASLPLLVWLATRALYRSIPKRTRARRVAA